MGDRSGFGRGFSGKSNEKPRGKFARKGGQRGGQADLSRDWVPVTKLGRLVRDGKITSLQEIYSYSLPIREHQVIDFFYEGKKSGEDGSLVGCLRDEVVKIVPVQKQTRAGQRTRFKAFVIVGDYDGHFGFGVKSAKEVTMAIRGAIIQAKLSLIHVVRGFWGSQIGLPHTVPTKVSGKSASVQVRLIPAPRGTRIVGAPTVKKMLTLAGLKDCFTCSNGHCKTRGNLMMATYHALSETQRSLSFEATKMDHYTVSPYQKYSLYLQSAGKDITYNAYGKSQRLTNPLDASEVLCK